MSDDEIDLLCNPPTADDLATMNDATLIVSRISVKNYCDVLQKFHDGTEELDADEKCILIVFAGVGLRASANAYRKRPNTG